MKFVRSAGLALATAAIILLTFEIALVGIFGYNEYFQGDPNFKIQRTGGRHSEYKQNVTVVQKHWENDIKVEYSFNENGRRDAPVSSNLTQGIPCLALVGDSFTLGSMLPIENVFHTIAVRDFHEEQYCVHNYGVGGEQLDQVFDRLEKLEAASYQKIIYAMTPNDLFDVVAASVPNKNIQQKKVDIASERENLGGFVKDWVLSRAITRFMLHTALSNDMIYFNLYLQRKPYSEYLAKELTPRYALALSKLREKIEASPKNVRQKLHIFLIPQRAEVVQRRLSQDRGAFNSALLKLCRKVDVPCGTVDLDELKVTQSHFPVDGHLTSEGSIVVAKSFGLFLSGRTSESFHGIDVK